MISMAITTYNRYQMTIDCFAMIVDNPFISEFIIMDDKSTDDSFEKLGEYFNGKTKVKISQQHKNKGMSRNKRDAIALCKSEWVLIADSDNIFYDNIIDAISEAQNKYYFEKLIYAPSFAEPNFSYKEFEGMIIDTENVKEVIVKDMGNCLFNTANYVVNKRFYLDTYIYNPKHIASDTIWHNYNHLKNGGSIYVAKDFSYYHRVHAGSGFLEDVNKNMQNSEEVRKLILQLSD